jgi:hypothetical protein
VDLILTGLAQLAADDVERGERLADGTILRQQEAVGPMILLGRVSHGTKRVKLAVPGGWRHNVVAKVIGDMNSAMGCLHEPNLKHFFLIGNLY